jgi:hypothetical protein
LGQRAGFSSVRMILNMKLITWLRKCFHKSFIVAGPPKAERIVLFRIWLESLT